MFRPDHVLKVVRVLLSEPSRSGQLSGLSGVTCGGGGGAGRGQGCVGMKDGRFKIESQPPTRPPHGAQAKYLARGIALSEPLSQILEWKLKCMVPFYHSHLNSFGR